MCPDLKCVHIRTLLVLFNFVHLLGNEVLEIPWFFSVNFPYWLTTVHDLPLCLSTDYNGQVYAQTMTKCTSFLLLISLTIYFDKDFSIKIFHLSTDVSRHRVEGLKSKKKFGLFCKVLKSLIYLSEKNDCVALHIRI